MTRQSTTESTQRDLERFEHVIVPHLDDAYTFARYLLRDEHDAQDVVHDAVLRALRYFGGYAGGDARAWLLAIVRNCALTFQRRHRGARTMVALPDDLRADDESDTRAISRSERIRVQRAIDALPQEFREVIVLREGEELSYREIATVIDAPIGTVMSRLTRARQKLAVLLGDDTREVG